MLKTHWFYRSGNGNRWKYIGFIDRAIDIVEKNDSCIRKPVRATVKPNPGNRATDLGSGLAILALDKLWGTLTAEGCLGKNMLWPVYICHWCWKVFSGFVFLLIWPAIPSSLRRSAASPCQSAQQWSQQHQWTSTMMHPSRSDNHLK